MHDTDMNVFQFPISWNDWFAESGCLKTVCETPGVNPNGKAVAAEFETLHVRVNADEPVKPQRRKL